MSTKDGPCGTHITLSTKTLMLEEDGSQTRYQETSIAVIRKPTYVSEKRNDGKSREHWKLPVKHYFIHGIQLEPHGKLRIGRNGEVKQ
jgi:hypothetical protein